MPKRTNQLKMLAEEAKKRLKTGDYSDPKIQSKKAYYSSYFYKNLTAIRRKVCQIKIAKIPDNVNDAFYDKVADILAEDEDTLNPISKLCDPEKMKNMTSIEKEFYILKLVDQFLKAKEKYFNLKQA